MDDLAIRRFEMFKRVAAFGTTYSNAFPPDSFGGELFEAINKIISELSAHATAQTVGTRTARVGSTTKGNAREALSEAMEAISLTTRSIERKIPGTEDRFRMPRKPIDQALLAAAKAFAIEAAPLKAEFIRREMSPNFLEELNGAIADFEKAITEQTLGTSTQVTATAAIEEKVDEGMDIVRRDLDPIVKNKYRDNEAVLAAWESAKHVERSPRSAPAPDTSTPA